MKAKQKTGIISTLAVIALIVYSCKKNETAQGQQNIASAPVLPDAPYNYSASSNDDAATLGRVLFYDKNLSLNNSVACASCHQQNKAFCDNQKLSTGLEDGKTRRNSPSIFAKSGRMFWDGRAASMADLAMRPIKNHVEMKFENLSALASKLSKIDYYPTLFKKAFGSSLIDSLSIQKALAEFLKNFNFSNNKFHRSQLKQETLTATEEIGRTVFFGKGRCFNCHHIEQNVNPVFFDSLEVGGGGYGFTDQSFNIGLDDQYEDNGLGELPGNAGRDGEFMVPVLLNVEYTAPYMHDGRFGTLEQVVEHYNSGIRNHPNLSDNLRDTDPFENMTEKELLDKFDTNHNGIIEPSEINAIGPVRLGLDDIEKRGLVAFLKTLSDPSVYNDKRFSNPFVAK